MRYKDYGFSEWCGYGRRFSKANKSYPEPDYAVQHCPYMDCPCMAHNRGEYPYEDTRSNYYEDIDYYDEEFPFFMPRIVEVDPGELF